MSLSIKESNGIVLSSITQLNNDCKEILDPKGHPIRRVEEAGLYICDGVVHFVKSIDKLVESAASEALHSSKALHSSHSTYSYWLMPKFFWMMMVFMLAITLVSARLYVKKQRSYAPVKTVMETEAASTAAVR